MKNDIFIARMAKGAAVSTVAGALLMAQNHLVTAATPFRHDDACVSESPLVDEQRPQQETEQVVSYTLHESAKEWTKKMEREFRQLALLEATGRLTREQTMRLEELSQSRERLVTPRTPEEILMQLRRDKMVESMAETLRKYVHFQESTDKKRASA
jgi:hypothetical protein